LFIYPGLAIHRIPEPGTRPVEAEEMALVFHCTGDRKMMPAVKTLVPGVSPAMEDQISLVNTARGTGYFRKTNVVTDDRGNCYTVDVKCKNVISGMKEFLFHGGAVLGVIVKSGV